MKRHELLRELERAGCELYRHGKKHDIYINPSNGRKAPIPRHTEIKNSRNYSGHHGAPDFGSRRSNVETSLAALG